MKVLPRLSAYGLLSLVALLCLFPLGWAALTSLKTREEVFEDPYGLPAAPQWGNYLRAWEIGRFNQYTLNSLILSVSTVLLVLLLSLLLGYWLSQTRARARNTVFMLFLLGLMVPIHGFMVPLFQNLQALSLLNSRIGTILAMTATALPFAVYLVRQAVDELPASLIEAALVDGARPLQILRMVVLPLLKPTILALGTLQFIWAWNEFTIPLITLHVDDLRPVPVGLTFFSTRFSVDHALSAAGTIIASAPLVVVYLLFQRHFVQGILAGSLKS